MIEDFWTFVFGLTQSVGSAATAAALFFVAYQVILQRKGLKQTQANFDETLKQTNQQLDLTCEQVNQTQANFDETLKQTNQQLDLTREQVNQTQQQMDSTLRPWIGNISAKSPALEQQNGPSRILFYFRNYGQIPATSCNFKYIISHKKVTTEELFGAEWDKAGGGVLLPGNELEYILENNPKVPVPTAEGEEMWVGLLFEYQYPSKRKGEFRCIFSYDLGVKDFAGKVWIA